MRVDGDALLADGLVATIVAAEGTRILELLGRGRPPDRIAEDLGLDPRAVDLVLGVLSSIFYVDHEHRRLPADPIKRWPDVRRFLETGEVSPHIDRAELRGPGYAETVLALGAAFGPAARELAERMPPARRILDVGAGSGVWSLTMAAESPETRVVGLDLPEVAPAFELHAHALAVQDQAEVIQGDWLEVEPEGRFDRIILANVLHLESAESASRMVQRFERHLEPDGELVIVDFMSPSTTTRRQALAIYRLHLGMRTRVGEPHDLAVLEAMAQEAGLGATQLIELSRGGMCLAALVARRTGAARERDVAMATLPAAELEALRQELAVLARRNQVAFGGAKDAMMVIRHQTDRIAAVNAAFCTMFETTPAVQDYRPFFAPDDLPRFERLLRDVRAGRVESTGRYRFVMVRRDGERIDAELTSFDPKHRSSAAFVIRDRAELAKQEKMETLGALAAGIAHDLNTPLGVLSSDVALIEKIAGRLTPDPESARLIEQLRAAAERSQAAVDRIRGMVASVEKFATLDGASLKELGPSFGSSVTRALAERLTKS